MDLPELQIDNILRYLGGAARQEDDPPSHTCTNYLTIDLSYCTQQEDGDLL